MPERGDRPLTVLGIYPWDRFWSMGEFKGAPSFFLAPQALLKAGHSVHISMPKGGEITLTSEAGPRNEAASAEGGAAAANVESAAAHGESQPRAVGAETYHGIKLHRYGFAIDFMPMKGHPFFIHLTRLFRYLYYLMLATLAGLRAARVCKPDVVVGYGAWAAPIAFFVARSMGLPNVTRLFGQSLSFGGGAGLRGAVRTFLNYPEIVAFLTSCSSLIVCDDGSGGDAVARRMGVPAGRIRFWRNGVDKELFRPPQDRREIKAGLGLNPDAPMLLSVSRLDAEKHHERLIQALPGLLETFPDAIIYILGEGPERGYLESEASRLGLTKSVRMPGAVPQDALARYYKACDVFLSLSDRTNVANPTLEAMCCGAPVVLLDKGTTSGVVRSGEHATVVKEEDLPELGKILIDLLGDESKRFALGEGAAVFAAEHVPSIEERSKLEADAVTAVARIKRPH